MTTFSILIPTYQPGNDLIKLAHDCREQYPQQTFIVVNDGSDSGCDGVFRALQGLQVIVLQHRAHRGNSAALHTGFKYWQQHFASQQQGMVIADSSEELDQIMQLGKNLNQQNELHVIYQPPLRCLSLLDKAAGGLFKLLNRRFFKVPGLKTHALPKKLVQQLASTNKLQTNIGLELLLQARALKLAIKLWDAFKTTGAEANALDVELDYPC